MAGSITSLGTGSNLGLQDILDKLQASENQRLTIISARQDSYKAKLSAYSQIQNSLSSLQKAAAALSDPKTFNAVKGTTSGDAVSIRTSAGALPAEYAIEVEQLATSQRLQSAEQSSRTEQNGKGGEITITLADNTTKTIKLGSDTSLNGIVKAINGTDDAGVNAAVVSDGSGSKFYLMLTTKDTGTEAAVTKIEVTDNDTLAGILSYDASASSGNALTEQQEAKNALLTINGIEVTSQSNTVSNIVDNVTFILASTTEEDKPITATVTKDNTAAGAAVQAFVSAYNSLRSTIQNVTQFDVAAETQSALTGDSTARNIQNSMAAALRVFVGENTDIQSLSDLGITTDHTDGSLDIDISKLNDALNNNPAEVVRLLSGADGLSKSFEKATASILGSDGKSGTLAASQQGIQNTIDDLSDQYTRTKTLIEGTIDIYRKQFVQLDSLVAQMSQLSSYLTQQFSSLSSSDK